MTLSFLEAALGTNKVVNIPRVETCETCHGSGAKNGTSLSTCTECNGTGQVRYTQNTIFGHVVQVGICKSCGGKGKIITDPCTVCGGVGTTKQTRNLKIAIPAGIDNEQIITVKGEGNSNGKGVKGDLQLHISVTPHSMLKRNGFDLQITVPIPFSISLLGGEIEVPGVNETLRLKIPELTQTNTIFNVRGKGIKKLKKDAYGDLLVTVTVEMPKTLDKKTKSQLTEILSSVGDTNYSKYKDYLNKLTK
jgi:molecular chaperone DnaJ